ncbi:phage head-binding domain-containing protein [Xenorhabdus taiwanensis]|uniref:Bacteriophage P22 tailspike N-terminal domain-containing protein n=1 Tax=Xenorhabdus taiwanensis TaxID=3085177 RepID=A0ABM8JYD3_9GAMM|nr:hypothetical protein TCT1_26270 [Xenorhabdus sp. TCT-1]
MSEIIPNVVVSMPSQLFTMARSFKACSNGKIYIGKINTDPTLPENQIDVYIEREDGSYIPTMQPIIINQAGYPVYAGQISKFVTVEGHSMAVYDAYGSQQFYFPNILKYDPDQGIVRFKNELSSTDSDNPGTNLIGIPGNGNLTSYLSNGRGIDPKMPPFNYKESDPIEKRTESIHAAFKEADRTKKSVVFSGLYKIDRLQLFDHSDYSIEGFGGIIAEGIGGDGIFCIEMKNCINVNWNGNISLNGKAGFAGGVKVWSDKPSGSARLQLRINVIGAAIAWQFGDKEHPDRYLSEIRVHSCQTYNVREVVRVIGTQTIIEFNGCQMVANSGTIGDNIVCVGTLYGGNLTINGGEVMMTSDPNGQLFRSFPINSVDFAKSYGLIIVNGSPIESAGLWLNAYNIDNIDSPAPGTGGLIFSSCTGYTPFSGVNIQLNGEFNGKISIGNDCYFTRIGEKNTQIVHCNQDCHPIIRLNDDAFDSNFPKGFSAITGGILSFSFRQITQLTNLMGAVYPKNTTNNIVFKSMDATGENPYYGVNYDLSTGVFTVPIGGLKSVRIHLEINFSSSITDASVSAIVNSVTKGICAISSRRLSADFELGNLSYGDTISLRIFNPNDSTETTSSNLDFISFSAAN